MSGSNLAFGCAAEPTAEWVRRVEWLAWSLRTFGGTSACAPLHACFAGDVSDDLVAPLRALDVHVHRVPRFDDRLAYANKLRLLELDEELGPEVEAIAMVDCDIVFTGDPAPFIPVDAVAAKPADADPLDRRGWQRLTDALGLVLPPRDVVASTTGRLMPRYFNSGVVVVPRDRQASVRTAWASWLYRVVDLLSSEPGTVPAARRIFADQYALMAAMAEHDGVALPVEANCPTHVRIHRSVVPARDPAVLHYHARAWPTGLLQRPVSPVARPAAARYNAARAAASGLRDPELRRPPARQRVTGARAQVEDRIRASWTFTRVRTALGEHRDRVA